MNNTQVDELVRLLEEYELAIARLYETFASVFPESRKHWMSFGEEEAFTLNGSINSMDT